MITRGTKAKLLNEKDEILVSNGKGWERLPIVAIHCGWTTVNLILAGKHERKVWFYLDEVVQKVVD